jgi:FkbM family methyltransferase
VVTGGIRVALFLWREWMKKYLNYDLRTDGVNLLDTNSMFHELFQRKDYDWWYEIQPGDIVVDLGACVGFFTCHALDKGASKVYAVEANRNHLKTLCYNVADHWIDTGESPVVPIHGAIGINDRYALNYYGEDTTAPRYELMDLVYKYQIHEIDYLKIDIEGAEFDIFSQKNMLFLKHHVKHISVEFHLDAFREAPYEWIEFRDKICKNFNMEKVRFLKHEDHALAHDNEKLRGEWPIGWGSSFMLYITN